MLGKVEQPENSRPENPLGIDAPNARFEEEPSYHGVEEVPNFEGHDEFMEGDFSNEDFNNLFR